jgi:hypothetical protein
MTAQVCETLIVDGERHQMAFCPPLPPDPRHLILNVRHEYRRAKDGSTDYDKCIATWIDAEGVEHVEEESPFIFSTACWRQYIGTWEIKDDRFYLVGLTGRIRLARPGPLFADWFTGVLRVRLGNEMVYVHMGFGSVYEQELHIMVERGLVKGRRVYDNRGSEHDEHRLGWENLPGGENRFPGDRDFN